MAYKKETHQERLDRYFKIVELTYRGYAPKLIAELLGIGIGTVYKRLSKGAPKSKAVLYQFLQGQPNYVKNGRDRVREMVRHRDHYTCQECGRVWNRTMRRFDVHHLNGLCGKKSRGYDSVGETDGLTTLCHKCHMSKHVDNMKTNRGKLKNVDPYVLAERIEAGESYDSVARSLGASSAAIYSHLRNIRL